MSKWNVFGRGFDSRRLHQSSLVAERRARLPPKLDYSKCMEKPAFYYVYILQSTVGFDRFYTGFAENLESRLKDHNSGKNPHTTKYKPWN